MKELLINFTQIKLNTAKSVWACAIHTVLLITPIFTSTFPPSIIKINNVIIVINIVVHTGIWTVDH